MQDTPPAPQHQAQPHTPQIAPPQPTEHHTVAHGDYSSNPMDTVKESLRTFWQNSKQSFIAVIAIDTIVAFVSGLAFIVGLIAGFIAIFLGLLQAGNQFVVAVYDALNAQLPVGLTEMFSGGTGVMAAIAVVACALGLYLSSFLQATFYAYSAMGVIHRQTAHIGHAMRQALKRTGPLFVQGVLFFAVIFAAIALPLILLAGSPGAATSPILILYMLALVVACVIIGFRVSLAPFVVVSDNMGPVQSIKYSWKLLRRRTWELAGVLSPIAIAQLVIGTLFAGLRAATEDSTGLGLAISFIELVAAIALSFVAVAVVAQFYRQVRTASETGAHHRVNYGLNVGVVAAAIVALFIASSIQSSLQPQPTIDLNNYTTPSSNLDDSTAPRDDIYDQLYNSDNTGDTPIEVNPYNYQ